MKDAQLEFDPESSEENEQSTFAEKNAKTQPAEIRSIDNENPTSGASVSTNKRPSILRSSRFSFENAQDCAPAIVSASDSSFPSLSSSASIQSTNSDTTLDISRPRRAVFAHRSASEPSLQQQQPTRSTKFDPQIFVREFYRSPEEQNANLWFSPDELQLFQTAAAAGHRGPLLFSHPSLSHHHDDEDDTNNSTIRRILVLDPHDVSAARVARGVQQLFPKAQVQVRRQLPTSSCNYSYYYWDVIVVAERWQPLWYRRSAAHTGGSAWLTKSNMGEGRGARRVLLIGMSAHEEDRAVMEAAGVDLFWSLPLALPLEKHVAEQMEHMRKDKTAAGGG